MGQLLAIVLVVIFACAVGAAMQRGSAVQRAVGHLLLGAGGLATGFMLALLLGLLLWPSAFAILGGTYQPLPPDRDRWASIEYFAIVGGCGAVLPILAFRLGYAAGALAVVGQSLDYWAARDLDWVILVGIAAWVVVAALVRAVAWWLRPDLPDQAERSRR